MSPRDSETAPWYRRHAFWLLLTIAAYFLWMEHRAHVITYLPLALLAACVGIYFLMHGSHGSHGPEDTHPQTDVQPERLSSDTTTEETEQREEGR